MLPNGIEVCVSSNARSRSSHPDRFADHATDYGGWGPYNPSGDDWYMGFDFGLKDGRAFIYYYGPKMTEQEAVNLQAAWEQLFAHGNINDSIGEFFNFCVRSQLVGVDPV